MHIKVVSHTPMWSIYLMSNWHQAWWVYIFHLYGLNSIAACQNDRTDLHYCFYSCLHLNLTILPNLLGVLDDAPSSSIASWHFSLNLWHDSTNGTCIPTLFLSTTWETQLTLSLLEWMRYLTPHCIWSQKVTQDAFRVQEWADPTSKRSLSTVLKSYLFLIISYSACHKQKLNKKPQNLSGTFFGGQEIISSIVRKKLFAIKKIIS